MVTLYTVIFKNSNRNELVFILMILKTQNPGSSTHGASATGTLLTMQSMIGYLQAIMLPERQ